MAFIARHFDRLHEWLAQALCTHMERSRWPEPSPELVAARAARSRERVRDYWL